MRSAWQHRGKMRAVPHARPPHLPQVPPNNSAPPQHCFPAGAFHLHRSHCLQLCTLHLSVGICRNYCSPAPYLSQFISCAPTIYLCISIPTYFYTSIPIYLFNYTDRYSVSLCYTSALIQILRIHVLHLHTDMDRYAVPTCYSSIPTQTDTQFLCVTPL